MSPLGFGEHRMSLCKQHRCSSVHSSRPFSFHPGLKLLLCPAAVQSDHAILKGMAQSTVVVSSKGMQRIRAGHLWIYRSDVDEIRGAEGGEIVRVENSVGHCLGQAFYSDRSKISLRLLAQSEKRIGTDWWKSRLEACSRRRERLASETRAFRLVNGEGDGLPSLIVDCYGDVLVLQTLSQGAERAKDLLIELLIDNFSPRAVIERNDVRARSLEGLSEQKGLVYGELADVEEVEMNGITWQVDLLEGQKTGCFLDQRENYLAARRWGHGRALDCFTYQGGFALHLAAVCEEVRAIDASEAAVAAAEKNRKRNGLDNLEFQTANVFDELNRLDSSGEKFDTIVLDPPAFAKNRKSVRGARRGYKEINLRAMRLLRPEGILVTCTCSYHMTEDRFLNVIHEASADTRRPLQLLEKRTQAGDHPVRVGMPETLYLKCFLLRVLE